MLNKLPELLTDWQPEGIEEGGERWRE